MNVCACTCVCEGNSYAPRLTTVYLPAAATNLPPWQLQEGKTQPRVERMLCLLLSTSSGLHFLPPLPTFIFLSPLNRPLEAALSNFS